ncbi:MAG TPA: hypothetical protein VL405_01200 [Sphingomonas sp.]|jgi:hypothetical protein|nr:hypothetical protein [Sphingomonas sp.]
MPIADPIPATVAEPEVHNRKTALTDDIRTHFSGDAPITEKATSFAKARPWATGALLGVAGLAILNTLRGRR